MALINYANKEINAKVVYYGPGLSGKTTNIQYVFEKLNPKHRGKLITLPTQTDRTLFFDFLPIEIPDVKGFTTRFHLYTVPGQVFYNATRKMVLKGVDGVVLVVDSQTEKMNDNIASLKNLEENLQEYGKSIDTLPFIIQFNKRDLKNIDDISDLNKSLNLKDYPTYEAIAIQGKGVLETLSAISKMVLRNLKDSYESQKIVQYTEAQKEKGAVEVQEDEVIKVKGVTTDTGTKIKEPNDHLGVMGDYSDGGLGAGHGEEGINGEVEIDTVQGEVARDGGHLGGEEDEKIEVVGDDPTVGVRGGEVDLSGGYLRGEGEGMETPVEIEGMGVEDIDEVKEIDEIDEIEEIEELNVEDIQMEDDGVPLRSRDDAPLARDNASEKSLDLILGGEIERIGPTSFKLPLTFRLKDVRKDITLNISFKVSDSDEDKDIF